MSLVDEARRAGEELRRARADYGNAIREAQEQFEGHPDAEVPITPRTTLTLRTGRLVLVREGLEDVPVVDLAAMDTVDAPGWLLQKIADALPQLMKA